MAEEASSIRSCDHCGKTSVPLKRCSTCKKASYCSAECMQTAREGHRKRCAPPLPLNEVFQTVDGADQASDWRQTLRFSGRMEEMLHNQDDETCNDVLRAFSRAHLLGIAGSSKEDHAVEVVRIEGRRVDLLGRVGFFREQGVALCNIADSLLFLEKRPDAARSSPFLPLPATLRTLPSPGHALLLALPPAPPPPGPSPNP